MINVWVKEGWKELQQQQDDDGGSSFKSKLPIH